jgi:site-specific recombinase
MLILFSFGIFGLVATVTGFLMFALPEKYVATVNWYYSRRNSTKRVSLESYTPWYSRLSGFLLFLSSFLFYYEFWIQLKTIVQRQ